MVTEIATLALAALPDCPLLDPAATRERSAGHSVVIRPPSTTKSLPVPVWPADCDLFGAVPRGPRDGRCENRSERRGRETDAHDRNDDTDASVGSRRALTELDNALTCDDFAAMRRGCPFINAST